jgi:hypothetical protein
LTLATCAHAPPPRPRNNPVTAGDCVEQPVIPPRVPPPEPQGKDCLTHADVQNVMKQLTNGTTEVENVRLVSAECRKRVYGWNGRRFVFWDTQDSVHGKMSTKTCELPTDACIERALTLANEYVPFANTLMRKAAEQSPDLWRDPDVGAVSFLQCNAYGEPSFNSIETMLHETNHRLSPDKCIFDWSTGGEFCLELDRKLPEGKIAAYPRPPEALDDDAIEWFRHVQKVYLFDNEQGIRNLLEEVISYSATSEMLAVGAARRIYPKPGRSTYNNLPLLMSITARYLSELAARDPAMAAKEFGPKGRNRAVVEAVLARGEASYKRWLDSGAKVSVFERTFWDDYQRARDDWRARTR